MRSLNESWQEARRFLAVMIDGYRTPLRAGDVGGRVGWKRLGVDGDAAATLLKQSSRRQSNRSAAQHGDVFNSGCINFTAGQLGRSPGESHAAAAVPVVVDDQFLIEFLSGDHESGWPEGPQSDDGTNLTVGGDVDLG